MQGVTDAALRQKESGRFGFINPVDGEQNDLFSSIPISKVAFDVAVTVEGTSGTKKGAGTAIKVIEAKLESGSATKTVGESRVTFEVPICLPTTELRR